MINKKRILAMREGSYVAVLRPDDPRQSQKRSREIAAMPAATDAERVIQAQAFNALLNEQPHTFIGLLADRGKYPDICDYAGNVLRAHLYGDSMINHAQFQIVCGHAAIIGTRIMPSTLPAGQGAGVESEHLR